MSGVFELRADRDRARTIAVALEQENAELDRALDLAETQANMHAQDSIVFQRECDKLRTALTTVLDILGDPADDEACALQCLGPQVIARLREAAL